MGEIIKNIEIILETWNFFEPTEYIDQQKKLDGVGPVENRPSTGSVNYTYLDNLR